MFSTRICRRKQNIIDDGFYQNGLYDLKHTRRAAEIGSAARLILFVYILYFL